MKANNGILLKNRVREFRIKARLRQADLAHAVAVTRQTILAIEKGRLNPSMLLGLRIAQVLGEPVGLVFYLDTAPEVAEASGCGQTGAGADVLGTLGVPGG